MFPPEPVATHYVASTVFACVACFDSSPDCLDLNQFGEIWPHFEVARILPTTVAEKTPSTSLFSAFTLFPFQLGKVCLSFLLLSLPSSLHSTCLGFISQLFPMQPHIRQGRVALCCTRLLLLLLLLCRVVVVALLACRCFVFCCCAVLCWSCCPLLCVCMCVCASTNTSTSSTSTNTTTSTTTNTQRSSTGLTVTYLTNVPVVPSSTLSFEFLCRMSLLSSRPFDAR